MFKLFMQAGPASMTVLTILLVTLFFAAWKAPRWVKEIGIFALVFGFLTRMIGFYQAYSTLQEVALAQGEGVTGLFDLISPSLVFAGLKVTMIPVLYGIIIYMISLIIRVIQKPRL